jgi:hypothetical protein
MNFYCQALLRLGQERCRPEEDATSAEVWLAEELGCRESGAIELLSLAWRFCSAVSGQAIYLSA